MVSDGDRRRGELWKFKPQITAVLVSQFKAQLPIIISESLPDILRPFNGNAVGRTEKVVDHEVIKFDRSLESESIEVNQLAGALIDGEKIVGWTSDGIFDFPRSR